MEIYAMIFMEVGRENTFCQFEIPAEYRIRASIYF